MVDEATGRGTCIVDLDTVQPGLVHYDIGDATRSACNPAGEDAPELSSVIFDLDLFTTIYRGYQSHAKDFLSPADHRHLFDCIHLIPLELGIRFLADHLAGDVYFKVRRPAHNLERARSQFATRIIGEPGGANASTSSAASAPTACCQRARSSNGSSGRK